MKFKEYRKLIKEHERNNPGATYSIGDIYEGPFENSLIGDYVPSKEGYYNLDPGKYNKYSYPADVDKIGDYKAALKYVDDAEKYVNSNPNPYDIEINKLNNYTNDGRTLFKTEGGLESLHRNVNNLINATGPWKHTLGKGESYIIVNDDNIAVKTSKGNYYLYDYYYGKFKDKVKDPNVKQQLSNQPTYNSLNDLQTELNRRDKLFNYNVKLYNAQYADMPAYRNRWDWDSELKELRDDYYKNQTKDFYENVNPKKPWPYGE